MRCPSNSLAAEISIIFSENSVKISATGQLKNNCYLELNTALEVELPFLKIEPQNLSCNFRNWPYSIRLKAGQFLKERNNPLKIIPDNDRIVLDLLLKWKRDK